MDPRIERTRVAVLGAALGLLAERGFAQFSMEGVAAASGVAKSTIYRHWHTRLDLLRDAVEELNRQPKLELEDLPPRRAIERLLEHLVLALSDSLVGRCIPALIEAAEHHPEAADFLYAYSERRHSTLKAFVAKGIAAGEFPASLDPELAALALAGPIFYRRLMSSKPFAAGDIRTLIQQVLMGARDHPGRQDAVSTTQVVHSDAEIMSGTPVFVGTRVPVQALLDHVEEGDSMEQFLDSFPSVTREQAVEYLRQAGLSMRDDAGSHG